MADPVLFDPAIEHLLREVAADPDSCLLRVPRPAVVKSLAHRQGVVRSSATGLSSVERELLRVHRAELAKLLREACVFRLANHPKAEFELSRHLTATRQTPVMSAAEWRAKAKYTLDETRNAKPPLAGMELLDACIAPGGVESTSVAQLAIASVRLEPTDAARIYPAIELTLDGQEEMALRVLHEVLAGFCSRAYAAYAWMLLGRVQSEREQVLAAREAYAMATQLDGSLVVPLLSLLGSACEIGSVDEITAFERKLDEQLDSKREALRDYAMAMRARCATGRLALNREQAALLSRSRDRVGPTARMVFDALL